jgi:homoserine dehydrogenase
VLSDISALTYGYRYEYKKRTQDKLTYSNQATVDVIVSFQDDRVKPSDFTVFGGGYRGKGLQYLKGSVPLERIRLWANDPGVNVILDAQARFEPIKEVQAGTLTYA